MMSALVLVVTYAAWFLCGYLAGRRSERDEASDRAMGLRE